MRSLKTFLNDNIDFLVEKAMEFAKAICDEMDITLAKRRNEDRES